MNNIHVIDLKFQGLSDNIAAFLLETSEGAVLFETGPHSCFETLQQGVADAGYAIEDIKHVFLTHIHLDHAGAAWAMAKLGATIHLHPFGYKHMADPSKLMASAKRIYQEHMDRLWGQMEAIAADKLHTVAHEEEIVVGNKTIKSWHTPGHAKHHIAWQIGEDLIAGDVAGVSINGGPPIPPCPPPDINLEDWQVSLKLIKGLGVKNTYLTHFNAITNLEKHANQLEERLLKWAEWIKPHYERGARPEAILKDFTQFVREDLQAHGVSKADTARYEAANPSWMSVAGLMRYWKKKEAS